MLSILIPTYNYDCHDLVRELHRQATECNILFEIIVANDCSTLSLTKLNEINNLPNFKLINLEHNLGRAKIRNYLASISQYNTLLFLDSDSYPASKNFIANYIKYINSNITLLGGRIYRVAQTPNHSLLTKYGSTYEQNQGDIHVSHRPFTSPNFLIPKDIFNQNKFNENIKGYGHEDTLFGIELQRKGIPYYRFDNPIIHLQIEENRIFLKKTEESIENLYRIYMSNEYPELTQISPILNLYSKLKYIRLSSAFAYIYKKFSKQLIDRCDRPNPKLDLFSLYKLCYLCHIATQK